MTSTSKQLLQLRDRIQRGDVTSTEKLIEELNSPRDVEMNMLWGKQFIQWFNTVDNDVVDRESLQEWVQFSVVKEKKTLKSFVDALFNRVETKFIGDEKFLEILDFALQTVDPAVFNKNPADLITLCNRLLERLDLDSNELNEDTFPSYKCVLTSLNKAIIMIGKVSTKKLKVEKNRGVYAKFKGKLETLASLGKGTYYPYIYNAKVLVQGLARLGKAPPKMDEAKRKAFHALKASYHLFNVAKGLMSFDLDVGSIIDGVSEIQEAFTSLEAGKDEWYDVLQVCVRVAVATSLDSKNFPALQTGLVKLPSFNEKDRTALHFGIIQTLKDLAVLSFNKGDDALNSKIIGLLTIFSKDPAWFKDEIIKNELKIVISELRDIKISSVRLGSLFWDVLHCIEVEIEQEISLPISIVTAKQWLAINYGKYEKIKSLFSDEVFFSITGAHFELVLAKKESAEKNPPQALSLKELFGPVEGKKDARVETSRVLIAAAAGMGKTTLCKKLLFQWSVGEHPEWDAIYYLPVRILKDGKYASNSLDRIIADTCFARKENTDVDARLVVSVKQQLESAKTLIILDGMDELQGEDNPIVAEILEAKCKLLITSRPNRSINFPFDKEVQLEELPVEKRDEYIDLVFKERRSALQMKEYLTSQPVLGRLARVPVTLQILCALWMNDTSEENKSGGGSTTLLYRQLLRYSWERYTKTEKNLDNENRDQLFRSLGAIALLGMEKDETLISSKTVETVLAEVRKNTLIRTMMLGSGMLSKSLNEYEFTHRTFQEFFAGQELARLFLSDKGVEKERALEILNKFKYDAKYQVLIYFTAGEVLVNRKDSTAELERFIDALGLFPEKPRGKFDIECSVEILGFRHLVLHLSCVNEWLFIGEPYFKENHFGYLDEQFRFTETLQIWFQRGIEASDLFDFKDKAFFKAISNSMSSIANVLKHCPRTVDMLVAEYSKSDLISGKETLLRETLVTLAKTVPAFSNKVHTALIEKIEKLEAGNAYRELDALSDIVLLPKDAENLLEYAASDVLYKGSLLNTILFILPERIELAFDIIFKSENSFSGIAYSLIDKLFTDHFKTTAPAFMKGLGIREHRDWIVRNLLVVSSRPTCGPGIALIAPEFLKIVESLDPYDAILDSSFALLLVSLKFTKSELIAKELLALLTNFLGKGVSIGYEVVVELPSLLLSLPQDELLFDFILDKLLGKLQSGESSLGHFLRALTDVVAPDQVPVKKVLKRISDLDTVDDLKNWEPMISFLSREKSEAIVNILSAKLAVSTNEAFKSSLLNNLVNALSIQGEELAVKLLSDKKSFQNEFLKLAVIRSLASSYVELNSADLKDKLVKISAEGLKDNLEAVRVESASALSRIISHSPEAVEKYVPDLLTLVRAGLIWPYQPTLFSKIEIENQTLEALILRVFSDADEVRTNALLCLTEIVVKNPIFLPQIKDVFVKVFEKQDSDYNSRYCAYEGLLKIIESKPDEVVDLWDLLFKEATLNDGSLYTCLPSSLASSYLRHRPEMTENLLEMLEHMVTPDSRPVEESSANDARTEGNQTEPQADTPPNATVGTALHMTPVEDTALPAEKSTATQVLEDSGLKLKSLIPIGEADRVELSLSLIAAAGLTNPELAERCCKALFQGFQTYPDEDVFFDIDYFDELAQAFPKIYAISFFDFLSNPELVLGEAYESSDEPIAAFIKAMELAPGEILPHLLLKLPQLSESSLSYILLCLDQCSTKAIVDGFIACSLDKRDIPYVSTRFWEEPLVLRRGQIWVYQKIGGCFKIPVSSDFDFKSFVQRNVF